MRRPTYLAAGIAILLLGQMGAARANETDAMIRRLVAQARQQAEVRNSETLAKTLYDIVEMLPAASPDGVSAVNELSRYLAGPGASQQGQIPLPLVAPAPASPPPPVRDAPVPQSASTVDQALPAPLQPEPASAEPPDTKLPKASDAVIELLRRQGASALGAGDVSGARRFYQRGADAGCGACAEALARTYDAEQLRRLGAVGIKADPVQAEAWRARARRLQQAGTLGTKESR